MINKSQTIDENVTYYCICDSINLSEKYILCGIFTDTLHSNYGLISHTKSMANELLAIVYDQ